MRGFIKQILPPFLLALARGRPPRTHPSWAQTLAACPAAYADDRLNRFRHERARLNLAELGENDLTAGYALLKFAAFSAGGGIPVIVDFGGGCGEYGHVLGRHLSRKIDYRVVENETLARLCGSDPAFSWATFTSTPPASADIFFTSGTVQYLPEPYDVLERCFSTTREFVILARNSFSRTERSFHVQRSRLADNGAGRTLPSGYDPEQPIFYPHGTIEIERVMAIAAQAGWDPFVTLPNESGVRGGSEEFGCDIAFRRRDPIST
jgi:putative methyltransferase (TIGR04325 family)